MAERNPRIPHSIESLLFVNRDGKYCGYKLELISENISADLREFLICAECEGISRRARNWGGYTFCEMCVPEQRIIPEVLLVDIDPIPGQYYGDIAKRAGNTVASLNAKCPLSGEGCGWEGRLREIEEHLGECLKVRLECQWEYDISIETGSYEQYNREVCPSKMKRCDYCKQEVQANEENRHKGKCQRHPDAEVPCPYKECGCEAIVLRKNRNTHLTENMTSHNKLMQDKINQLSQLRNKNQRLDRINQQQENRNEKQERVNEQQKNRNEKLERVNEQQNNRNEELERVNEQQKNRNEKQERVNQQQKVWSQQLERVNEQHKVWDQQLERVNEQQKNRNEKQERINEQQKVRNQQLERVNEQKKFWNQQLERVNEQQRIKNEELARVNEQQRIKNEELARVNEQQRVKNEEQERVNEQQKNMPFWDRVRSHFK